MVKIKVLVPGTVELDSLGDNGVSPELIPLLETYSLSTTIYAIANITSDYGRAASCKKECDKAFGLLVAAARILDRFGVIIVK